MDISDYPASGGSTGASRLVDFLYPAPAPRETGKIIRWWEKRRLGYNMVLAAFGTGTLALAYLLESWHMMADTPLGGGLMVMAMGNLCYTLGWITEVIVNKIWGRTLLPVGPMLLRAGLTLSVGVVFIIPSILLVISFLGRLLTGNL